MNEEQRAVLATIQQMERRVGTLIDEYTVARQSGILASDLGGAEFSNSPAREQVRLLLDELERLGMVRLERARYWQPRTTLAGRRALEGVAPLVPPQQSAGDSYAGDYDRPVTRGAVRTAGAAGYAGHSGSQADYGYDEPADDGWPTWWPVSLRVGHPTITPLLIALLAGIILLALIILAGSLIARRSATTSPTTTLAVAAPSPTNSGIIVAVATSTPAPSTAATPARTPTPRQQGQPPPPPTPAQPTPTAGPPASKVMVVNTENKGVYLRATPAGERSIAVSEGTILDVIGPDERDTQGNNWKHVRYGNQEGWLLEEYTTPAQ